MDKLTKIGYYLRWMKGGESRCNNESSDFDNLRVGSDMETSKKLFSILERILLWENSVNSISVVIVFNILFWGVVVLEIRGFAAASSAALVVILCYSTLEGQIEKEQNNTTASTISSPTTEKIDKIISKARSTYSELKALRRNQPGVFCTGICTASVILWLIGRAINGVLLTYTLCMSILLGPALFLRIPGKIFPTKEWDNEIEEFLPAVTEDNLEVLKRAGDNGDHSPTPPASETPNDPFNDDELIGLKMPSHEDGSTDGLELSELELSTDGDIQDMKIKTKHFERDSSSSSSSDDDPELDIKNRELSSNSDDSESEFEIIDSHEINDFNKV